MKKQTDPQLALKDDDEHLVLQGRQILRRVLNEARFQLEELHKSATTKGEIVRASADPELLAKLILDAAKKELAPAKKVKEIPSVSDSSNQTA